MERNKKNTVNTINNQAVTKISVIIIFFKYRKKFLAYLKKVFLKLTIDILLNNN